MSQWIFKSNGQVVPRRKVRPLKTEEIHGSIEQKKRDLFDELITCRWGAFPNLPSKPASNMEFVVNEDK